MNLAEDPVPIDESVVCRWLSWSFARELDDEALRVYTGDGAAPLFVYLSQYPELIPTLERLQKAIAGWSELADPKFELAADYATIFLGSGDAGAPLYASCYEPPGRLFGPAHERMLKRLQATGLVASLMPEEPADHLALMLDYLAHCLAAPTLAPTAAHAFEDSSTFIQDELLTWLPALQVKAERIEVATDTHKALVALTFAFLDALSRPGSDATD